MNTPLAQGLTPTTLWPTPVPRYTYLAGAAGSGKTVATQQWEAQDPSLLLCATTGIAAINLGGTTINAALGYFDTESLREIYTNGFLTAKLGKLWKAGITRIILDEVSMLDANQLTVLVRSVEEVNGRGYVLKGADEYGVAPSMGLTVVGDFAQLPPVKAPFAFESPEWERFAEFQLTLTEIRRQSERPFIEALRAARAGDGRRALDYFGDRLQMQTEDSFEGPTILARNDNVDRFNGLRLDKLKTPPLVFSSTRWGKQRSEWGNPAKPPHTWGIPARLFLKEGTLVMILSNQRNAARDDFEYVNGDLGTLVGGQEDTALVRLQRTGEVVTVHPVIRTVQQPIDAARRKEIKATGQGVLATNERFEVLGAVTYMPLRLAYATTVHKAQGLSLDAVQVNIRDPFFKTPGMLYVALSRARTAAGLRVVGTPQAFLERCLADPRLKDRL